MVLVLARLLCLLPHYGSCPLSSSRRSSGPGRAGTCVRFTCKLQLYLPLMLLWVGEEHPLFEPPLQDRQPEGLRWSPAMEPCTSNGGNSGVLTADGANLWKNFTRSCGDPESLRANSRTASPFRSAPTSTCCCCPRRTTASVQKVLLKSTQCRCVLHAHSCACV